MKRTALALVLIPIVSLAGCARATAMQASSSVPQQQTIDLFSGIAVDSGPMLTALPPGQRYRFVPPEALVNGISSLEESSFGEPDLAKWRKQFASIVGRGRWVQSADSAQFDVTVFRTGRMTVQRVDRPQNAPYAQSNCQYALQPVPCLDDPILFTEQTRIEYRTFFIIRRRADGAVRVWNNSRRVAAEVPHMLRATPSSHAVIPSAHDLALARKELEGSDDVLFVPAAPLDSLARAFAALRRVDSLSAAELGEYHADRTHSEILLRVGVPSRDSTVRQLSDSLAHCAGIRPGSTVWNGQDGVPFPRTCWSALDRALAPILDASVITAGYSEHLLWLVVTVPPTVDRYALSRRMEEYTGLSHVLPNSDLGGGTSRELQREGRVWRFRFTRGYGDCPSGCIYNRIYEYRYDTRTGRAWKHSESGDPYPPPGGER